MGTAAKDKTNIQSQFSKATVFNYDGNLCMHRHHLLKANPVAAPVGLVVYPRQITLTPKDLSFNGKSVKIPI
jgi:hypothetical protein